MKKHKHYNVIRAYADGWKIWSPITLPAFSEQVEYRIVPEDGWLPWYGGECPTGLSKTIRLKFSDGSVSSVQSDKEVFWDDTVIAYKNIDEEPKPKKKVKMWQWIVQYSNDTPCLTSHFFPTIERARSAVGGVILQSADWTEIEVEES